MKQNESNINEINYQDVTAIITSMTDGEKPFICEAVTAVLSDPCIIHVILCIEKKNDWIEKEIGSFMADPRLQIIRFPIMLCGAIRNKALNMVKTPWVTYCDADDVWCKGKTLIQQTFASRMGCDFVGADHYLTDEAGKIRAFALARYMPMLSSWLVRTEIMRKYPFNETMCTGSDGEWWYRTTNIIQKARCPKMLLRYRVRTESLSSLTNSKIRKAKIVTFAKIPVLGLSVLFLTFCTWLIGRKNHYMWSESWGPEPHTLKNQAIMKKANLVL